VIAAGRRFLGRLYAGQLAPAERPEFAKLLAGQTISLLGSTVSDLAIPMLAILALQATAPQMGILSAASRLPYLLFGLFVGAWVDRLRRRPILISADLVRGVLTLLIPIGAWAGALRMEVLWFIAFLLTIATVFFDVAYRAFLPTLVARDRLVEANSRLQASASTTSIVGPGLAGLLVQTLGATLAVLADAVSFFASALSLALIRVKETPAPATDRRNIVAEIWEGLRWLLAHPVMRLLTLMTAIFNVFAWFVFVLWILYMVRDLHLLPAQIGLIFALGAPGALLGSALAPRINRTLGLGRGFVLARVMMQAGLAAIPAALGPTILLMGELACGSFVFGFGVTLSNLLQNSYRQAITPEHLQGRANAALLTIVYGVGPIGALLAGWLGITLGVRPTLWVGVAGTTIPLVMLVLSPIRRLGSIAAEVERSTA
jgi:MFS family permease